MKAVRDRQGRYGHRDAIVILVAVRMRNGVRVGDLIKTLWHDTQGMCLFVKRLEAGWFIWPFPAEVL
jgi:transposase